MGILKDILYKVPLISAKGDMNIRFNAIQFDSRKVEQGDLFVAVRGTETDGHAYIDQAIEKGAVAIIYECDPGKYNKKVTYVKTSNSALALGIMASGFYGNPSAKMCVVAVTGTNGKTTTVTLLHRLFRKLGYETGLLSTIENKINERTLTATHTTPDAVQINRVMAEMVQQGCTHCFMEASSHAIEQNRTAGLTIQLAVFSNISHDHLDYHKTFDAYIKAKKKLFDELPPLSVALINIDDKRGLIMSQNTKAVKKTFGIKKMADYKGKVLSDTMEGLELDIQGTTAWFPLVGEFNAYNLLSAYAVADLLGEDPVEIMTSLSSIDRVPGRFERVRPETGILAIVDYAHTPNALENVLITITRLRTKNEKVITVVGCGGDRDRQKRPEMAAIACNFSDKVIFTSDNPRTEDPEKIIAEMQKGVSPVAYKKTLSIVNRKEAIKAACTMAEKNDIILVAGKGHETYQEINGVKYDFDDRQVLSEMLDLMVN